MSNAYNGYSRTRQQSETLARALRDAAVLIGEPPQTATLATASQIVPGLGLVSEAAILERRARDLEEGLFKVLVYGEFKHGKSTLLNALLGSRLLPAKTLKCTAIISVLVHGTREEVAVYRTSDEQPTYLSRDDFRRQFQLTAADEETLHDQGYVDRFKNIAYAQIECTSPLCANGVRLVDSPGLGDHPSRTRVTTKYLREAHAIVFVLNAMRLLSDDEKAFIRAEFKPGQMERVFFVVNRVNQINPHEVEEVQNYFRGFLTPYFARPAAPSAGGTPSPGAFDADLYTRRVFFVDALGALEARTNGADGTTRLARSGIPALEQELERFLTSDQRNNTALTEAAACLSTFVDEALQTIAQQRALQDVPLERFEQTLGDVAQHLQRLERRKEEIERTIQRFGATIAHKLSADLRDFLRDLRENWATDAQGLNLDEVSFRTILTSFFQGVIDKEAAQRRISEPIKREVERYLQEKTRAWTYERVPAHIQPDLDTLLREIEEQVVEFKLDLERTSMLVTPEFIPDPQKERERFSLWTQALIGETLRNITGVEGAITEWGDWSSVLWRVVQQLVLVYIVVTFSGPIGWTIFAVAQLVQFIWTEQQFRQKLLEKIGGELHKNLDSELPRMQQEVERDVQQQFTRLASGLTTALQQQIDEKRREMARILDQKRDMTFSAEQEKQRLDGIGTRLVALREQANQTVRFQGAGQP